MIAAGDYSLTVPESKYRELNNLAADFTSMATAVRAREEQLQKLVEQLNLANSELQRFAEVSAHHLQEPARRLVSYARLLRDSLLSRDADKAETGLALQYIEEGAERLRHLLRDIQLYLAAAEPRGKVSAMSTEKVLAEVMEELAGAIKQAEARFILSPLPPVYLDRLRLQDIFKILITNALQYSRPGVPPRISISGEKRGQMVCLRLEDNGRGIPSPYHERVFGVFERLQHTDLEQKGTGIGLAIVRRIVQSYSGRVWLKNAAQEGAVVELLLPATGMNDG